MLRDSEIRSALRAKLQSIHAQEPDTAIIDELSLCQGNARIDMAVVNGAFSGYEIKSDRDTLARLPRQLAVYETCFDTMTIVVGAKYAAGCEENVPEWWGIWEATSTEHGIAFTTRREPRHNVSIAADQVVQLLWKQELQDSLRIRGVTLSTKSGKKQLSSTLVAAVPPPELFKIVRERIRARGDWRSAPTPFRCGDLSRSFAMSQRSQKNRRWLLSALSQRRPN
jgi:hypothetical protein